MEAPPTFVTIWNSSDKNLSFSLHQKYTGVWEPFTLGPNEESTYQDFTQIKIITDESLSAKIYDTVELKPNTKYKLY
ncbi:hypothetical protein MYX76_19020, partial [Desulfobacterota bacterium AH_259_B03_O07]|nr:hypothetical protein [Desulfobacterota bacterium AH_259_B03_O07]